MSNATSSPSTPLVQRCREKARTDSSVGVASWLKVSAKAGAAAPPFSSTERSCAQRAAGVGVSIGRDARRRAQTAGGGPPRRGDQPEAARGGARLRYACNSCSAAHAVPPQTGSMPRRRAARPPLRCSGCRACARCCRTTSGSRPCPWQRGTEDYRTPPFAATSELFAQRASEPRAIQVWECRTPTRTCNSARRGSCACSGGKGARRRSAAVVDVAGYRAREPSGAARARTHRQCSRRGGQGQDCDDGELHDA